MPCEDTGRVGVKCLQGREGQVLQATTRSYERGLELTLHRKHQRESALPTSQSHIPGLLNCERIHFSCLKASPLWYFMMEALGNSYNFQQSSDRIWLIFLIGEVWDHIVLLVLHAYRYWLHTWKTCLLKGHKVLIWVLDFFIPLAFACRALSVWT